MKSEEAVGFSLLPLPFWLRGANRVADMIGAGRDALTPERLMADAARAAGLPAEFPPHIHEALEVLCASIRDEAQLHWIGIVNSQELLVTGLAQFLQVEKAFVADPSLAQEPLISPVLVTGIPRSGTTFLHRLLAATPDAVGVPLYRHVYPVQPKRFDYRHLDVRIKFFPWLSASNVYGIDAIHYVRPDLPDECNFGLRLGGRSMIYWSTAPCHTYLRWLLAQDLRETYQFYRKVLILHQRANPGRRLTLKCPQHLAWLPALAEALPEATIVETHRDPVECLPSESNLILSLHATSVREIDWQRIVESNHFKLLTYAQRTVAYANSPEGARIHRVDYRKLVRDPVSVARQVHERSGLLFTESHERSISEYAAENKQHKHGKHRYSAEEFGLDPKTIANDFAEYRERFLEPSN